jgi:hypothetical protein
VTDLEAEPNPALNELFQKGSVEFLFDGYIVHLARGKTTVSNANCYSLSVNGIELNTPIVHYITTGYFMFSIPDNLRRGESGVIWDQNLYNAVTGVITDPWFKPWFEEVVTTAELLTKGAWTIPLVPISCKLKKTTNITENDDFIMFSVFVNGVVWDSGYFISALGSPQNLDFQARTLSMGREKYWSTITIHTMPYSGGLYTSLTQP